MAATISIDVTGLAPLADAIGSIEKGVADIINAATAATDPDIRRRWQLMQLQGQEDWYYGVIRPAAIAAGLPIPPVPQPPPLPASVPKAGS